MDGFKNTTKTQYSMGGYATGGSAKFGKVMREFKAGTLHSGSKKGPAVTSPKQAFAIAASEARKAPMKKQAGGPVASKTGTRTDPEYGDFVAAGAAKPSAMAAKKAIPVVKKAVPVASRTPMVSTKKPLPRAMFGDEAAAAMDRSGKAGMTAAEKREGYNMGGSAMRMAEGDYGYKKGGRAKGSKGPKVMAEKTVATKRTATPTMNAQEMRTMERYQTAMASRPNRQPIVAEGKRTAAALTPILRRAMAAAPPAMNEGALPMTPPAMKKGGKARFQVMRKAEGGAVTLSFTPPSAPPAGQRWIQRDDGPLVLVSTAPNATYTGRSGTVKNVSDLSIYQGGNAYIPAANFAANSAPEVIANLQRVGGLPDAYKAPAAGTLAPPASNPAFQSTGNVDPRNLAETYRASVPGYSYGEDPAGERQFFKYAVAPGAPPPYKAGGAVSVPKTALAARTAQKHTAAMASRPNRKPMVGGDMRKGGTPR